MNKLKFWLLNGSFMVCAVVCLICYLYSREEIFQVDHKTETYYQFILLIQETMLHSYNFLEDACIHLDWLKEKINEVEQVNPLVKMYADDNIASLVKTWEDLCAGESHGMYSGSLFLGPLKITTTRLLKSLFVRADYFCFHF